jgi:uncharacterized protein involved in cysteine biosynthesis
LPILFTARIFALATLPLLAAAIAWIVIAYFAWAPVTGVLAGFFGASGADASALQRFAAQVVAALVFAALAIATALATVALLLFVPLWLASLPLLVFPPLYAVASLALNGWLSQRMFRYDALAEHASADEIAAVIALARKRLLGLGLALAPLSLVPIVNVLVLPIYAGIAFSELCLDELARLRARRHVPATGTA